MNHALVYLGLMGVVLGGAGQRLRAQGLPTHPAFRDGEVLLYQLAGERSDLTGTVRLQVGLDSMNDRAVYVISLDYSVRGAGPMMTGQMRSWVDTETLSTVYLTRCVQTPGGEHNEMVDVAAALNAWSDSAGTHPLDAQEPLDDLSLLYLLRGLPDSESWESLVLDRHYDAARNPVRIRQLGRTTVTALGTVHRATIVELEVNDKDAATGRARVYLGRDEVRLPLRIDLTLTGVGVLRLGLQSATDGRRIALSDPAW
jgi:hypothetical protein